MRRLKVRRDFYLTCGAIALAVAACSDNNIVGTSTEPNTFALGSSSSVTENTSSSVVGNSSSSLFGLSSSAVELSSSAQTLSSSAVELSSSAQTLSSSSAWPLSSSSRNPVLCKAGYWGGCSPSAQGDLWAGDYGVYKVNTGLYADPSWKNKASGEFFWETDGADGGESYVRWSVEPGNASSEFALDPVIDDCKGLCGAAVLNKGSLTYDPFVSIGFTLAKEYDNATDSLYGLGRAIPVDVSNWNGFCIAYMANASAALVLDMGDSVNALLSYALPMVDLHKSSSEKSACFEWKDFKLPSWVKNPTIANLDKLKELGWLENAGEMAAKHLVAVRFNMQARPGEYDFKIMALGTNLD